MQIVWVRLRKPSRVLDFAAEDTFKLERDEPCIVESDRGLEYGNCVIPPAPLSEEDAKKLSMKVVRKASLSDESTYHQLLMEEAKAKTVCAKKIEAHQLAMKLVDAEYTFDRKKVIFYFTAEERVDFRELVRDLAHDLKARIELRHIQVRDQAKMVGGLGACGRELCCTSWLREFMPISMRMAKRQNLSLNPSKISGQCGRLMCCLSYENDLYERKTKRIAFEPEVHAEADEHEDDFFDAPQHEEDVVRDETPAPLRALEEQSTARAADQEQQQDQQGDRPKRRRKRRRKRPATSDSPSSGQE
jgi:cell fate regulator YaaT (PSP1 superfamily)